MPCRCAILGCGPRAHGHAKAYPLVEGGELIACCDVDDSRLHPFAETYDIPAAYTSLDEMLQRERPDIVHVVTPPTFRVELMQKLSDAGVPGAIIEKPICIGADDYHALRELDAETKTRFIVNHQLRHHPRVLQFLREVREGAIGQVLLLDASAVLPMSGQGVHVLDLMFAFNDYSPVRSVYALCEGYDDINGTHPSPRTVIMQLVFANGARGMLTAGAGAPRICGDAGWMNKRIAVYGSRGYRHWRLNGWDLSDADGVVHSADHDYGEEDVQGEAALIGALIDWLQDEGSPAPTRLQVSLDEWLILLSAYQSHLTHEPVSFPFDPPDDLLQRYQRSVGAGG